MNQATKIECNFIMKNMRINVFPIFRLEQNDKGISLKHCHARKKPIYLFVSGYVTHYPNDPMASLWTLGCHKPLIPCIKTFWYLSNLKASLFVYKIQIKLFFQCNVSSSCTSQQILSFNYGNDFPITEVSKRNYR